MGSMHATCPTHHSEPLAMYKGTMQTNAAFGPHLVRFPFHGYVFLIEIIPRNSENPSRLMPKPKKPRPRMSPRPCHMKVALAAPATRTRTFQPVKLPPLYSGGNQQVGILSVDGAWHSASQATRMVWSEGRGARAQCMCSHPGHVFLPCICVAPRRDF